MPSFLDNTLEETTDLFYYIGKRSELRLRTMIQINTIITLMILKW